ncbi:putative [Myosin heavy-chain] kinase transcription factor WD40-like family [Helianthus annuus]|nr:putative [Myosin heavy-chain] kinase transcription factor WD40-like family [Helianthus annuus]
MPLFPPEENSPRGRAKLGDLFHKSEPNILLTADQQHETDTGSHHRHSNVSPTISPNSSPVNYFMSPVHNTSPFSKSPWNFSLAGDGPVPKTGLIGSLTREEGHVYSLASSGDLLYTFSGFKSSSGLVKAIVVSGEKIFTGHQDGKIRVWKYSGPKKAYKRVGSLPTTREFIASSMNPGNYVEVRRHRKVPWIKHYDVVSCMSLDEEHGLLYSGSWDKTFKVWRLSDSKCMESVNAHDDAVNSVMAGFDGFIFTGSADGSMKVWRRELVGKETKHMMVYMLLNQDPAVTSVAVNATDAVVYAGSSDGLVNFWKGESTRWVTAGLLEGINKRCFVLRRRGGCCLVARRIRVFACGGGRPAVFIRCLSVLTGHDGPIKCLAVHEKQDGDDDDDGGGGGGDKEWVVYSGSLDKSVKLWVVGEAVK